MTVAFSITALVFSVNQLLKNFIKSELFLCLLPVLSGLFGGVLGVIAYYFVPSAIMADDLFSAIAVGIISGLSATGAHQAYKQLFVKLPKKKSP